ncbi:MAG: hypothetical protein AB7J13_02870, partial [Pyrinomonadaceae bacterium]
AAASKLSSYETAFGSSSTGNYLIGITKFPYNVPTGNWEADARGRTVTIASSDMPFRSQSLQRFHEQLRHELFHLWIPNGVNLTGNYDWFYEGFALYRSLKLGVAVNRIRFDDYLDTLSRAYDIDTMNTRPQSLIIASKGRFNGANTQLYARGMLVAFLCDLAMLNASKGKRSVDDILRQVYSGHSGDSAPVDGNAAVIAILKRHLELVPIVERYVSGAGKIDWTTQIAPAGLVAEPNGRPTRLVLKPKPSGRERVILDKLGYNNWRKLSDSK